MLKTLTAIVLTVLATALPALRIEPDLVATRLIEHLGRRSHVGTHIIIARLARRQRSAQRGA